MQSKLERGIDLHRAEGRKPKIGYLAAKQWNSAIAHRKWLERPGKSAEDIAAIEKAEAKREAKRQKRLARG